MRLRTTCSLVVAAILALAAHSRLVAAAEPVANIGTLTCVASPASKEPLGVERELSCTFAPVTGPQAKLTGVVKRLGAQVPGQAKIVLAWSVLAPDVATPAQSLEGRYVGSLGAPRNSESVGLVGGKGGGIALRPLTVAPDVGSNAAISVVELELSAMRA
ncbi:MAG: DUF992 domain-containing protein [Hyphomicrobiaceae bacterium]